MATAPSVHRLRGAIQSYPWGSRTTLAQFLGRPGPTEQPEAELWLGAHPRAPARVEIGGRWLALDEAIAGASRAWLGVETPGGGLPFLLKVLAVEQPLSLQAHPDDRQALEGVAREADLPHAERCYVDPRGKPELVCALTPFAALCGFRPLDEIRARLERPPLATLVPEPPASERDVLATLIERWLAATRPERSEWLAEAVDQARREASRERSSARVAALAAAFPDDPAALAPLFLNEVYLEPGEALYLPPGELHCYLRGTAIEMMAASDNVLRAGLTSKRVHREELLRVVRCVGGLPVVRSPRPIAPGVQVYETPAECFELTVLAPAEERAVTLDRRVGAEILLCMEGRVRVVAADAGLAMRRGESCVVAAAAGPYRLEGSGRVFRGALPDAGEGASRAGRDTA